MSFAMDKAMMVLSLEEEDEPFNMPNLPQFKSSERNSRSLIGRILNPECQKMSSLILDMPRKWQKRGKVRGVALSKERFQFIFDHEHDLQEILEKGVHTFNDWTLAIDRWVENPPLNYLQFIPIWVQIRNLPVNYYTKEAISALGDLIGEVVEVAFDPEKPQCQEFVRVLIRFNVARPLRKSKVVNLPEGGSAVVYFNYERIQKRCYECQRLNHAKDVCPFLVKTRKNLAEERNQRVLNEKLDAGKILTENDPLFGVLSEDQVGICKETGRRKIATVLLEEMRRYLMMATEEDRLVRIDRIRASVSDAEKDPLSQKTILRMEPAPKLTKQLDKGKGVVFDFDLNSVAQTRMEEARPKEKFMDSAIRANKDACSVSQLKQLQLQQDKSKSRVDKSAIMVYNPGSKKISELEQKEDEMFLAGNSTEYGSTSFVSGPSGVHQKITKPRKRPYIRKRQEQKRSSNILQQLYGSEAETEHVGNKRKVTGEESSGEKTARLKDARVIPHEGSPRSQ